VVALSDGKLNIIDSITFKTESQLGAESLVARIKENYLLFFRIHGILYAHYQR